MSESNSNSKDLAQRKQQLSQRLKALEAKAQAQSTQIRRRSMSSSSSCAYLLVDCSSSMADTKLSQAKDGAIEFAEGAFRKGYSVGIIYFSSEARFLTEPLTDIFKLREQVNKLEAQGTTNMTAALSLASNKFPSSGGAAIVVTDGIPNDVDAALRAAKKLKASGVDIITIGTDDADRHFLEQIASRKDLAVPVPQKQLASGIKSAAKLLPGKKK